MLLVVTVFFSTSAPNEAWAWLSTTATLAASLTVAILTSGAQKRAVRAGVALATVGYGDLTAAGGIGRALAIIEAPLGQIYLVTAVAALVSNLRPKNHELVR